MHGRAQSAHSPSRVPPSELDQQADGPRLPYEVWNQRLSRVPLPRTAQQVAGEKSRAPPLLRVADLRAYPKSRAPSTTVVRLASPLRPTSAVIAAVEVMVAFSGW